MATRGTKTQQLRTDPRRKPSQLATASAARHEVPSRTPRLSLHKTKSVRLTLWPLVAATFFMVSGGTYGIEDIVHGAGYCRAILLDRKSTRLNSSHLVISYAVF